MAQIRKFQIWVWVKGGGGESVEYYRALWGSGQFHKDMSDILPPTPSPLDDE